MNEQPTDDVAEDWAAETACPACGSTARKVVAPTKAWCSFCGTVEHV